jgi:S-adenosylmethionine:tRNA-ribosyltransferase-isomerase (queuine synthetase)
MAVEDDASTAVAAEIDRLRERFGDFPVDEYWKRSGSQSRQKRYTTVPGNCWCANAQLIR